MAPTTTSTLTKDSVFDQIKSGLEDSIEHSKKELPSSPLSPIAQQVCEKRYFQKDKDGNIIEDWKGLVTRVVNHVCKNEDEEFKEEIFDLIYNTKFLPNSPCLVNSGNEISGLLACHVSPDVEDSWVGMCKNIETFGHVARRGGGNGVCLSNIRPSGSKVFGSTHAKACGPVSHMIVVSEAMHSITQAGFRSMANMGTLHINHPDVIDFIHCKQRSVALKHLLREDIFNHHEQLKNLEDSKINILLDKHISNFNISVVVSNKFMEAVENDEDFNLEFEGKIYQTVKARELFNMIAENAWKNGDPGLLFDEAVNSGPYKYSKQKITATNPCVAEGSLVASQYGWKPAEELKVNDLVFTQGKLCPIDKIEVNDNYKVNRVEFTDGDYIDVTDAHQFKCVVGKKYEYLRCDEITEGARIVVEPIDINQMTQKEVKLKYDSVKKLELNNVKIPKYLRDLGLMLGSSLGDGCYTEKTPGYVCFDKKESEWQEIFESILKKYNIKYNEENDRSTNRLNSRILAVLLDSLGYEKTTALFKKIPYNLINTNNKELFIGILDGLFSTDGNMYLKKDNPMLRLTNSSYEMCKQVRRMLLSFGIHSKIYRSKRKPYLFNDPNTGPRVISCENDKFDVVMMNVGIVLFNSVIKLSNPYKQKKIEKCVKTYHFIGDTKVSTIRSITPLVNEVTVYDLYVKETDEWNVNGYVNRGCGEQPIPSSSSLGSGSCCNLGSIDISKYYDKKHNDLDWKSFKKAIHNCIQFLDNVIDANKFPTPDFAKWAKNNRPVGLGIMGFADLLLKMQIAYDSEEAFLFAEKLAKFLEDKSHEKSVQLAKDRGTPKACEYDELDQRRNVTLTSIAPTGSISLLAGCSSSIEPLFSPVIHRYDNTGSYVIPHIDKSKKYFRSAINKEEPNKEVCWQAHVKMQAAFQKYGSSGVSKTINMSNNATIEDVKQAYMLAYKTGCKGITVYRDGCKTTQVLNTSSKSQLGSNHAKPRPKEVEADIFKTRADGFDWHIIVGKVDDVPYEIFAVNGNDLPTSGKIIKRKKRHYSLVDNSENVLIDNIGAEQDHIDPKISLETRRLSLELRHNIDPKFIVEQIDKSNDVITSFSKVVSRILKTKYITDLTESVDMPCPECAKNNEFVQMVSEASCWKCLECSYSKCG